MLKKTFIFLILFFANILFANVNVLEISDDKIIVKINFDPFTYRSGMDIPVISLPFTAEINSNPQVSASPQNKFTMKIPDNLQNRAISPAVSYSTVRNIPLFFADISPVLSIKNNEITYTTEMLVVINYFASQTKKTVPKSDYYNAISAKILNRDRITNTILETKPAQTRAVAGDFNYIKGDALRFSIGDEPSASNYNECDLSSKAGIYKITRDDLRPLGTQIDLNKIRIYSSNPNVADSVTPSFDQLTNELNGLVKVPYIIRNDEILFYGEKIHTWIYDEDKNNWRFLFNFTDYRRYYWITLDGDVSDKMPNFSPPQETATSPQTTGDVYFRAKRSTAITTKYSGSDKHGDKRLVWTSLTPSRNTLADVEFPNSFLVNKSTDAAKIRFFAHEWTGNFLSINFSTTNANSVILRNNMENWTNFTANSASAKFSISANFREDNNGKYLDFDAYDLRYKQNLSLSGVNSMQFYSPESDEKTLVSYKISDLPQEFLLLRHNPKTQKTELIADGSNSGNSGNFEFLDSTGNGYKYHLSKETDFLPIPKNTEIIRKTVSKDNNYHIENLLETSNFADYLIVAPEIFLSQAVELAKHKKNTGQFISPKVVGINDILKTFSGGVFSPEAIRNFMVYTQNSWQKINGSPSPDYLTLFGGGHFDYKKNTQNNHIPVYISKAFTYKTDLISYPIEDFFGYTEEGSVAGNVILAGNLVNVPPRAFPNLIIGRIPAATTEQANAYLQKIKNLEGENADNSFWRNRPLLVSDDDIIYINTFDTMNHTEQSDNVGRIIAEADKTADVRKITLFEFPMDNRGYKPLAQRALIDEINNGVSIVNYFGHGSSTTLSDQRIFQNSDVASLTNFDRCFIFGAFSCSAGFFDDPSTFGLSQRLVLEQRQGRSIGAVAAISAARTAYSNENGALAYAFFESFYDNPLEPTSVGQAYLSGKAFQNVPTFLILGDPSYIPMPNRKKITDIKILNDEEKETYTLKKMQNVTISAKLPIPNDEILRTAEIILQNPENLSPTRKDGIIPPPQVNYDKYTMPGMIVARQTVDFTGNAFEAPLMIPPTVIDDSSGSAFKIHVSSKSDKTIFSGVKSDEIIFSGFDISNVDTTDNIGPTIVVQQIFSDSTGSMSDVSNNIVGNKITIDGFNRKSGTANLNIHISDKSGVDIFSSQSPGGGVSVSIEQAMSKKQFGKEDLTLVNDDFRSILLPFPVSKGLFAASGEYELTISARDILQNITTKRYILDVKSLEDEQYAIGDFFCYPSPVRMGQTTQFFFNQPLDNVSNISLKIYTLNGKLVRSFSNVNRGVIWDLTDQRGQKLSPNVYLYRLFVKRYVREDGYMSSSLGTKTEVIKSKVKKLVIHPPK